MNCPKCKNDQTIEFSYACGTYNCPTCSGCWMEYNPLRSYLEERDAIAAEAFQSIWDRRAEKSQNLKCPHDNKPLYIFIHNNVELEFCEQCRGLWFDANELKRYKIINPVKTQYTKNNSRADWQDHREYMYDFVSSFSDNF